MSDERIQYLYQAVDFLIDAPTPEERVNAASSLYQDYQTKLADLAANPPENHAEQSQDLRDMLSYLEKQLRMTSEGQKNLAEIDAKSYQELRDERDAQVKSLEEEISKNPNGFLGYGD